jgi:ribosomal silencing factor RsfS
LRPWPNRLRAPQQRKRQRNLGAKQGLRNGEWAVLDYSDMVVHVFHEETRESLCIRRIVGRREH